MHFALQLPAFGAARTAQRPQHKQAAPVCGCRHSNQKIGAATEADAVYCCRGRWLACQELARFLR